MVDRKIARGHEGDHARREEADFKLIARRNKLVGLWAAGLMGRADSEAYAKEVVMADLEEAGHDDIIRKLRADFEAAGKPKTDAEIEAKLHEMHAEARRQLEG